MPTVEHFVVDEVFKAGLKRFQGIDWQKADGEIRTPDRLITNQEHYHYATPATFAGGLL